MRSLFAAIAPLALTACEVFSGYSDPGFPPGDSSIDAGGDALQDVTTDSGHDVSDVSEADVVVDTGPTDTCDCTPGTTAKVSGGTCPIAGDEQRHTCGTDCKWETPFCVTPSGWRKIADPPSALVGRFQHTAVWTGTDMIVWGGTVDGNLGLADGATYSLATDTWTMLPAAPIKGRAGHTTVFAANSMIVWGGTDLSGTYFADGAMYDPILKSWKTIGSTSLAPRMEHAGGWVDAPTAHQMVIWGGHDATTFFGDGARYDPGTDGWKALPAAPISARGRTANSVVGTILAIWGGETKTSPSCPSDCPTDGAGYDLANDSWPIFASPGPTARVDPACAVIDDLNGRLALWGGETSSGATLEDGERANPTGTSWVPIDSAGSAFSAGASRSLSLAWGGAKFCVWSGHQGGNVFDDGACFDPTATSWTALPAAPIKGRINGTVVSTGKSVIVWGGLGSTGPAKNDGAVYVP
jgi:hypothetical protein